MIISPFSFIDQQGSSNAILLFNSKYNYSEEDHPNNPSQMNYLMGMNAKPFEIITLNRTAASNTTMLCNSIHSPDCVIIHHRM